MNEGENPSLIFEAEDGGPCDSSHVPLVLIHDGGGTCFSYHCLDPLGRPTYAIHNPRFNSQKPWAGGIPEMARLYVDLLRDAVPPGDVLLGGWSLGGTLSVEMARVLADDPRYRVVGIVMVDSVCPTVTRDLSRLPGGTKRVVPFRAGFDANTKQETIERVQWCFSEAIRALGSYDLPAWGEGRGDGPRTSVHDVSRTQISQPAIACPPAILIRAEEPVPVEDGEVSFVDTRRDDGALGWNEYQEGFFRDIMSTPGHHFSVFAWENIETLTARIIEACKRLETVAHSGSTATIR